MLVELQVENFRSFRDLQRFTMTASSDDSHEENTISVRSLGQQRLLRSAVIYGANAAGKSNLVAVFDFLEDFVTPREQRRPGIPIPIEPFKLDSRSRSAPSMIEVTFLKDGVRYQYGFRIDRNHVYEEWLLAYPKRTAQQWFRRTHEKGEDHPTWYFGPGLRGDKERLANLTRVDTLFLTTAVQFSQPQLAKVYDWFAYDLRVVTASQLGTEDLFEEFNAGLIRDEPHFEGAIQRLLQVADLGITGLDIKEESNSESSVPPNLPADIRERLLNATYTETRMRHRTQDDPDGGEFFPLTDESLGTIRLYRLGGPLWLVLQNSLFLAVDELDASLHPQIVRWVVKLFHARNRQFSTAQLLFNTHDTTLLDADLFRRDQIWFVEKDEAGASHLYSLLEYKPRKDEALGKGYLHGRYGAIPFMGGEWFETQDEREVPTLTGTVDHA